MVDDRMSECVPGFSGHVKQSRSDYFLLSQRCFVSPGSGRRPDSDLIMANLSIGRTIR